MGGYLGQRSALAPFSVDVAFGFAPLLAHHVGIKRLREHAALQKARPRI
jgi:hypothetical protein